MNLVYSSVSNGKILENINKYKSLVLNNNYDLNVKNDINDILINELKLHIEKYKEFNTNASILTNIYTDYYRVFNLTKNTKLNDFYMDKRKRVLTYLWFLNDEGTINFPECIINAEKGKIVIFPSEWFIEYSLNSNSVNMYFIIGYLYVDI